METKPISPVGALVRDVVRALVDHPERVTVEELALDKMTVIEVSMAKGDFGQTVGREGRIADAIRELLVSFGGRSRHRYTLEVLEPDDSAGLLPERPQIVAAERDPVPDTQRLLERLIVALVNEPGAVRVKSIQGRRAVVFEAKVAPGDVPRVIGAKGRVSIAVQQILSSLGSRAGLRYLMEVTAISS